MNAIFTRCPKCRERGALTINRAEFPTNEEWLSWKRPRLDTDGAPLILCPYCFRKRWTPELVKLAVEKDRERLFHPYTVGRPLGWSTDLRTRDLIAIGNFISEEVVRLGANEDDRRTQQQFYNRWSRSEDNLWDLAARTLNAVIAGEVEQNRVGHHRWG
jgi:hypothetical protein